MMLEVENFRRMVHPSGLFHGSSDFNQDHSGGMLYYPTATRPDKANPFIDWGKRTVSPPAMSVESKSDGEDEDEEYRPFTPPPPRERLSYTRYQLELLNGIYAKVRYPNSSQKQLIAKRVGITREQVKIWFQNRRRKDVVGKDKKSDDEDKNKNKSEDESSDISKSLSDCESISEDDPSSKEGNMVPTVVMKGIIGELKRYEKEAPKGKKKKKSKSMKQKQIKKNISSALLHSSYDMISPPNQVIPNGVVNRTTNKLNHSLRSSAFESPKESQALKYPTSVSTFLEHYSLHGNPNQPPFPMSGHSGLGPGHSGLGPVHSGCDLPVLSDLLSFKTGLESRTDDTLINSNTSPRSGQPNRQITCDNQGSLTMPYGLNRFYPLPFIAEQPLLLSTLRHSESFRHHMLPQSGYPEEQSVFQALPISALNNPYYAPTSSVAWSNQMQPSNFTQL